MVEWLLCRFYDILKPTMKWIIYLFHKTIWVSGSATTQILPITVQSLNKLDLLKTSLPLYMLILWFVAVVYNLGKCMGWQQQRMKSGYFPWTKPLFWHQNCTNANYLCWFSSLAVQRKLSLHKIMTPSSGYYLCSFFQRYLSAAKVCASFFLFLQILNLFPNSLSSSSAFLHFTHLFVITAKCRDISVVQILYAWSKIHNRPIDLIMN